MTEKKATITVLIVDDHPLFRRGLKDAIAEAPSLRVVGEAASGAEALSRYQELSPEVVVTDVDMPVMDGLQLAQELFKLDGQARIVFLTMHRDERIFDRAMEIGVNAFVSKDEIVDEIVQAIEYAADGRYYIPPSLSELVVARSRKATQSALQSTRLATLTPAERVVLKQVAANKTSKEIAAELGISIRTVGTHRNNIAQKLQLAGSMPLVNYALLHREEILQLDDSR